MSLKEQSLISVLNPVDSTRTEEFSKPIWEWTPAEKYEAASKYKAEGVELFRAKRHVDAFYKFSKACKILITLEPVQDEEDPVMKNIIDLKYVLYNNMAECQLIRENYDHVLTLCNKVLRHDKNNVKALYRRGTAYGGLRDFEKAVDDLKTVMSLQPNNKQAQEKLNIYTEKWHASVQGYENMVRKMFKT